MQPRVRFSALRPRKLNPKTGPFVGADSSPQTNPRLPPTHAGCFSRKKRCSSTYFAKNAFCLQTNTVAFATPTPRVVLCLTFPPSGAQRGRGRMRAACDNYQNFSLFRVKGHQSTPKRTKARMYQSHSQPPLAAPVQGPQGGVVDSDAGQLPPTSLALSVLPQVHGHTVVVALSRSLFAGNETDA